MYVYGVILVSSKFLWISLKLRCGIGWGIHDSVEFCMGARQSDLVSMWQHTLVGSGSIALPSCSADTVFILGTWYLNLRVLRLRTGEVCCKRTRQQRRQRLRQ